MASLRVSLFISYTIFFQTLRKKIILWSEKCCFFFFHNGEESHYNTKRETEGLKKRLAQNIPSIYVVRLVTYVVYFLRQLFFFNFISKYIGLAPVSGTIAISLFFFIVFQINRAFKLPAHWCITLSHSSLVNNFK